MSHAGARGLLVAAVVIWGWTFVATKVALVHLDPLELMALRFLIALPVLAIVARWRRVNLRPPALTLPVVAGAGVFTLHFMVQIAALEKTSAVHTGWLIALTPLALALLARVVLGERLPRRARVALVVASAGILLLVSQGDPRSLRETHAVGDLLVLVSVHTWALYTLAVRRATARFDPLALTWLVSLVAALAPLGLLAAQGRLPPLGRIPAEVWAMLVYLGVCGSALAQWFWQEGVARIGAARAGLFLYLEPLATTALAVTWLGEPLRATTIAGGLVALGAVAWAQRAPRALAPKAAPA